MRNFNLELNIYYISFFLFSANQIIFNFPAKVIRLKFFKIYKDLNHFYIVLTLYINQWTKNYTKYCDRKESAVMDK